MITLETNKERDGLGIAATLKVGDFACPIIEVTHDDLMAASPESSWTLKVGDDGEAELEVLARFPTGEGEFILCKIQNWGRLGLAEHLTFYNTASRAWTEAS